MSLVVCRPLFLRRTEGAGTSGDHAAAAPTGETVVQAWLAKRALKRADAWQRLGLDPL